MATWSELKFKLITTGDETGTWGDTTNSNIGNAIEQAITGTTDVVFADANVQLILTDSTDLQQGRALRLNLTGSIATPRNLQVPDIQKFYIVCNNLSDNIIVKNSTGDIYTVPPTTTAMVFSTGTGIKDAISFFSGAILSPAAVIGGGTIDDTAIGLTTPNTGDFTTLHATSATLTNPLPVTSGGTGVISSTGTNKLVLSDAPTILDGNLTGTPTAPTATAGTNTTQVATTQFVTGAVSTATGSLGTMSTQNANAVAITGGTITGITDLAVADGGTGQSSLTANALLTGNGTSGINTVAVGTDGQILTSNGTTWAAGSRITRSTVQNFAGTNVDFTNIPSWVKRITIMIADSNSGLTIQLGTGAGPTIVAAGYYSYWGSILGNTSSVAGGSSTTSFTGGQASTGAVWTITNLSGNTWTATFAGRASDRTVTGFGSITLAAALTAVRIATSSSTGTVNILYE